MKIASRFFKPDWKTFAAQLIASILFLYASHITPFLIDPELLRIMSKYEYEDAISEYFSVEANKEMFYLIMAWLSYTPFITFVFLLVLSSFITIKNKLSFLHPILLLIGVILLGISNVYNNDYVRVALYFPWRFLFNDAAYTLITNIITLFSLGLLLFLIKWPDNSVKPKEDEPSGLAA